MRRLFQAPVEIIQKTIADRHSLSDFHQVRQFRHRVPTCLGFDRASFSCWPGCVLGGLDTAHLLSVSGSTGAPNAACALKASEQPAWGSHPFYKSGIEPRAVNGRFHQLENVVDNLLRFSFRLSLTEHRSLRNRVGFQITPQINHQSPGHRHDADSPHPGTATTESSLVPLAQFAVRLQS